MDKRQALLDQIEQAWGDIIRRTQEFIRYPSTSGNESEAQGYFASLLEEMSLDVDMWEPDIEDTKINPYFLGERTNFRGSPNVAGVQRGCGGGRSLILIGHVDVVPQGRNDWHNEPFCGKLQDGKIYGRGASDMKGGLMAALMALKAVKDSGVTLRGDVTVQSVIEEESGGAGVLSVIKRGYKADAAIVPEPTDMRICPASIGAMWFRVTVKGLSAHAATAHLGVSAISKSVKIIDALSRLETARNGEGRHPFYEASPTPFSLTVGKINGGVFPTNVPEEVVMEGRMAIMPGEEVTTARSAFEAAIAAVASEDDWLREHRPLTEWFGFCFHSNEIDHDHGIVKALCNSYTRVTGREAVVGGTPWGTDAAAMTRFGGTPSVVFGPGPGETAHKANEYLDVQQLMDTTKVIALCILDWCDYVE
jgi:acetylornithine deacetylase